MKKEWTQPTIVGSSGSACDLALFAQLGMEHKAVYSDDCWVLVRKTHDSALTLVRPDGVALCLDFTAGKARHRSRESGSGAQALARSLGVKTYHRQHGQYPAIIDATGGLGQDAWALASIGCRVTIIEQHPVVHALLADALVRAASDSNTRETASSMDLIKANAESAIGALYTADTHAIYLDPMYPERRRTAASKKGMQFLHALLGPVPTEESPALLMTAIASGVSRVVVKRPKGAPYLAGTDRFKGQRTAVEMPNTRYDVYHCRDAGQVSATTGPGRFTNT